jgi:hypothetical protein
MTATEVLDARIGAVVGGVLRQLLADSGAHALTVAGAEADEARLVRRWIVRAAGENALRRESGSGVLVADPASKTTLLLHAVPPCAAVLPLGDLYATQVARLAGGCAVPPEVAALAERAGGMEVLDRALGRWVERREPLEQALGALPATARDAVAAAVERARFARRRVPLVPKLAGRTIGIDLFG